MVFVGVRVRHWLALSPRDIDVSVVNLGHRSDVVAVAAAGQVAAIGASGPVVHGPLVGGAHYGVCVVYVGRV